jgi:hypothetical protein
MNQIQRELFGSFPRRVGTPSQHWVFNEAQVELFLSTIAGRRNAYSTVGELAVTVDGEDTCDKVLFDLDSPAKADGGEWDIFEDEPADDEVVSRMRSDPDVADAILGEVCEEARTLARESLDDGIPVIGVFSGFGLHVHQLYKPTSGPSVAMQTCAMRYIDKLGLDTPDWSILGQPERICRIPNMERVTTPGQHGEVRDGRATGLYTIPLNAQQLKEVSPEWLVSRSQRPHHPDLPEVPSERSERPQMPVWEDYRDGAGEDREVPQRPVDSRTVPFEDGLDEILHSLLQMPCMAERIQQPNPENKVRLNSAVILFNVGLNPQQVEDLYARLGWVDFDRETTRAKLEHAWKTQYSDMSCRSLRDDGLCVKDDDPRECRCYGWSGGQPEW